MNWALNPPFSLKADGMAFMRYFFILVPISVSPCFVVFRRRAGKALRTLLCCLRRKVT
jgi:hypothetical protein